MPATKTDLLDRYLHAVKFWLPKAQQQDILAELAEDLHSQIDEREAALGHPLAEDDLAAILKKRGSPMSVAGAYLPEQRLINPAMLPIYRLVLKIVLLWVLLPLFAIVFVGPLFTSAHPERVLIAFCAEAWRAGFMVVGIVTAVFALLDRYHVKFKGFDQWDPHKLPRVPAAPDASARWNQLAGFIFGMLAAVCWVFLMGARTEFSFPGGLRFILGPVWKYLYWPVLGLTLTSASADLLAFLYPCWTLVRTRVRLGINAIQLLLALALLRVGNWGELASANLSAAEIVKAMTWVNAGIQIALISTAVIVVIDALLQIRILRAGHARPVAASGALCM
jgi:hypothetical protein